MGMDRIDELVNAAYECPPGSARTNLLEQAIDEADALGDHARGYQLRMDLTRSAVFHGQGERALATFAWCLAYADRNPGSVFMHSLLWHYKWILNVVPDLPQISRAKILELLDDMERRVKIEGDGPRSVLYKRWRVLFDMGDLTGAASEMERWRKASPDALDDCAACETNNETQFLAESHRDQEALDKAEPILAEKLKCASVPHATLGYLIRPLLRMGRFDDARRYSERGYKLIAKNEQHLWSVSEHLLFAAHSNQLVRGLKMFSRHAPWSTASGRPAHRFRFDCAASAFLQKLARAGIPVETDPTISKKTGKPRPPARLLLPADHPCHRDDDQYDPTELAAWYRQEAESLAEQFDRRNGNDFFTRWLNETHEPAGV